MSFLYLVSCPGKARPVWSAMGGKRWSGRRVSFDKMKIGGGRKFDRAREGGRMEG